LASLQPRAGTQQSRGKARNGGPQAVGVALRSITAARKGTEKQQKAGL